MNWIPTHEIDRNGRKVLVMLRGFVHELCMLVLLEVGDAHTFGGGAMAETTIRRVR